MNLGYNSIFESNYPTLNGRVKEIFWPEQAGRNLRWFYADSPSGTPYGGQKRKPDATD
jgi:hypothetical protein